MKNKKDRIGKSEQDFSWSFPYSLELEKSIQKGLEDFANNRVRPHHIVMAEFKEKYGF